MAPARLNQLRKRLLRDGRIESCLSGITSYLQRDHTSTRNRCLPALLWRPGRYLTCISWSRKCLLPGFERPDMCHQGLDLLVAELVGERLHFGLAVFGDPFLDVFGGPLIGQRG